MNKETQNFTSVDASSIYTQGAMANHTGSMNEKNINEQLCSLGFAPKKRRYESSWSTTGLSAVDCDLPSLGICAEYKYQGSTGTTDLKGVTELYNAGKKIECDDFVLVCSGTHWETARGRNMYETFENAAAEFNSCPEIFCIAAKRLHVMKPDEFIEFVEQRKKEKLQNG